VPKWESWLDGVLGSPTKVT